MAHEEVDRNDGAGRNRPLKMLHKETAGHSHSLRPISFNICEHFAGQFIRRQFAKEFIFSRAYFWLFTLILMKISFCPTQGTNDHPWSV